MELFSIVSFIGLISVAFAAPLTRHVVRQTGPGDSDLRNAIQNWISSVTILNEFLEFADGNPLDIKEIRRRAAKAVVIVRTEPEQLNVLASIEPLDRTTTSSIQGIRSDFKDSVLEPLQRLARGLKNADEIKAACELIDNNRCISMLKAIKNVIQVAATTSGIADDQLNITVPRPKTCAAQE